MNELLLAIIAGAGFSVSAMLGLVGVSVRASVRLASAAIAAGVLLAIIITDLVPDALEDAGRTRMAFGFVIGFAVLFVMEMLTHAHTHHHDDEGHDHHEHDAIAHHAHAKRPFLFGLGLHNITDGLAIGTTAALSSSAASAVTIGVIIHQLPVGVSFAAVLAAADASRRYIMRGALVLGAMIPIGAAIVHVLPLSTMTQGTLLAVAAGALTYVAAGHLLPEAQSERRHAIVGPAFIISILVTVAWFTLLMAE